VKSPLLFFSRLRPHPFRLAGIEFPDADDARQNFSSQQAAQRNARRESMPANTSGIKGISKARPMWLWQVRPAEGTKFHKQMRINALRGIDINPPASDISLLRDETRSNQQIELISLQRAAVVCFG
jgi:hypothetical protein